MNRMMTRKLFPGAVLILAVILVLTACGGNNSNNNGGTPATTPAPSNNTDAGAGNGGAQEEPKVEVTGTVTLAGSTSVQPLAEELGTAFMAAFDGTRIEVAGGGSGAGVKAAQSSTADIGMASRAIKDDETGIEPVVIAIDGIAVVINPNNNNATNLTTDQIKDIFTGQITNWQDVGGQNVDIVVVNREEGSGTRDAFAEIVLGGEAFTQQAIIQNSTGAVREAVGQDVNAIGYISFGGMNDSVKAISVNDVEATEANIIAGTYPIARPYNFLINDSQQPSEVTQAFIDYVLSADGQAIVVENGYIAIQ